MSDFDFAMNAICSAVFAYNAYRNACKEKTAMTILWAGLMISQIIGWNFHFYMGAE